MRQVNLYISKLFENIGHLVYNEVNDEDLKFNLLITGIQSHMGETLPLKQVGLSYNVSRIIFVVIVPVFI